MKWSFEPDNEAKLSTSEVSVLIQCYRRRAHRGQKTRLLFTTLPPQERRPSLLSHQPEKNEGWPRHLRLSLKRHRKLRLVKCLTKNFKEVLWEVLTHPKTTTSDTISAAQQPLVTNFYVSLRERRHERRSRPTHVRFISNIRRWPAAVETRPAVETRSGWKSERRLTTWRRLQMVLRRASPMVASSSRSSRAVPGISEGSLMRWTMR